MKGGREVTFQGVCSYSNKSMRSSLSSSAQLAWYLRRSNLDVFLVGMVGEGERGEDKGRERGEKKDAHSLACLGMDSLVHEKRQQLGAQLVAHNCLELTRHLHHKLVHCEQYIQGYL